MLFFYINHVVIVLGMYSSWVKREVGLMKII